MQQIVELGCATVDHSAVAMAKQANKHYRDIEVKANGFACLSSDHLCLVPGLSHKLAAKWVVPFHVVTSVRPVAFCLDLPADWHVHDVFNVLQLRLTYGAGTTNGFGTKTFCPEPDANNEYKVEN